MTVPLRCVENHRPAGLAQAVPPGLVSVLLARALQVAVAGLKNWSNRQRTNGYIFVQQRVWFLYKTETKSGRVFEPWIWARFRAYDASLSRNCLETPRTPESGRVFEPRFPNQLTSKSCPGERLFCDHLVPLLRARDRMKSGRVFEPRICARLGACDASLSRICLETPETVAAASDSPTCVCQPCSLGVLGLFASTGPS